MPNPDAPLRRDFLRARLDVSETLLETLVTGSAQMSFAHLQELVQLSGLLAVHAGRSARSEADLLRAVQQVRDTIEQVDRGFARPLEEPFGLRPRR